MISWRTSKSVLFFRNLARRLGVARVIRSLQQSKGYEDRFDAAMRDLVREGDVVWDIGANRGHYSEKFRNWIGPKGRVYAFEPSIRNQATFNRNLADSSGITLIGVALSNFNGISEFLELPGQGTTNHIMTTKNTRPTSGELTTVEVTTGDDLISSERAPTPTFIKIDTEGYEFEVIEGMPRILKNKGLRAVCIEMHFRLLSERNLNHAPKVIEDRLRNAGFRLHWCDASHLIAQRV